MRQLLIFTIKIYQSTFSPDHGWFQSKWPYGFCRYQPTCSQYAIDALEEYGVIKGARLATGRLLRCNPFAHPGVDQVPKS